MAAEAPASKPGHTLSGSHRAGVRVMAGRAGHAVAHGAAAGAAQQGFILAGSAIAAPYVTGAHKVHSGFGQIVARLKGRHRLAG